MADKVYLTPTPGSSGQRGRRPSLSGTEKDLEDSEEAD